MDDGDGFRLLRVTRRTLDRLVPSFDKPTFSCSNVQFASRATASLMKSERKTIFVLFRVPLPVSQLAVSLNASPDSIPERDETILPFPT